MIMLWMLLATLLGVLVAAGGLALEGVCRALRLPTRWAWASALVLAAALTALAPFRRASDTRIAPLPAVIATRSAEVAAPISRTALDQLRTALERTRATVDQRTTRAAHVIVRATTPADPWLAALWIASSVTLLAIALLVLRRIGREQREWPIATIDGERVHVAPGLGPAVVGVARTAIVVPRWLMRCSSDAQQLVIAHEREHLLARDPLLLVAAGAIAVLLPWNPAVWWMLARLRLAVELDCDRRVLRAGARTADYGSLLLDLAGRTSGMVPGAPLVAFPMLVERTTHLERRIVAMSAPRPRHPALRIAGGTLVALVAALAACESKLPTSVDVDRMTASSAERNAAAAGILSPEDSLRTYYVDGKVATAADARAIPADRIASVEIVRDASDPAKGSVRITTRDAAAANTPIRVTVRAKGSGLPGAEGTAFDASRFAGIIFIDGKRSDNAALTRLVPADIASIEILKGPRAAQLYPSEPAAAQGVIQVVTKAGAAKP